MHFALHNTPQRSKVVFLSRAYLYIIISIPKLGGDLHIPTYAQLDIRTDKPELRAEVESVPVAVSESLLASMSVAYPKKILQFFTAMSLRYTSYLSNI